LPGGDLPGANRPAPVPSDRGWTLGSGGSTGGRSWADRRVAGAETCRVL